jgi:transcriptional regulator
MFVRPCWRPASEKDAIDLIEHNPWALLVTNGPGGPLATNLPLLLDERRTDRRVLLGHVARGNAHSSLLRESTEPSLAIFEGPWSYVTASWYPGRDMPSTVYYTAVHCYGKLEWQTEDELDRTLEMLTQRMETPIPGGWKTSEIPRSEITRRFASIAGFAFHIERIEAKFKLGQDEPLRDAMAVAGRLDAINQPLAELIRIQNASRMS